MDFNDSSYFLQTHTLFEVESIKRYEQTYNGTKYTVAQKVVLKSDLSQEHFLHNFTFVPLELSPTSPNVLIGDQTRMDFEKFNIYLQHLCMPYSVSMLPKAIENLVNEYAAYNIWETIMLICEQDVQLETRRQNKKL